MNREIKFRLINNGRIVGYEKCQAAWTGDSTQIDEKTRRDIKTCKWFHSNIYQLSWCTSEPPIHDRKDEFTGRKDMHNKDEYAGDVIKQKGVLGIWLVIYEPPAFKGKCLSDVKPAVQIIGKKYKNSLLGDISNLNVKDFEVIGNVHQNPELIEEPK